MEERIQKTIKALEANGFEVAYFETQNEAKAALLEDIEIGATVGFGGSVTLFDMGIHEALKERSNPIFWHWLVAPDLRKAVRASAIKADVYLSSSNAITEDGKLINIDGTGNRVASLIYGHKAVYIVAGVNKIAENYEAGMKRIKEVACPQNALRLDLDTPCRHTGKCNDCRSKQRMCNATVVLERNPNNARFKVFLINDTLGY